MRRILMWVAYPPLRDVLSELLRDEGHHVDAPTSMSEVLSQVWSGSRTQLERPDLVLVDGEEDGRAISTTKEQLPNVPVIVLSSLNTDERGDVEIERPFTVRELLAAISTALRRDRAADLQGR